MGPKGEEFKLKVEMQRIPEGEKEANARLTALRQIVADKKILNKKAGLYIDNWIQNSALGELDITATNDKDAFNKDANTLTISNDEGLFITLKLFENKFWHYSWDTLRLLQEYSKEKNIDFSILDEQMRKIFSEAIKQFNLRKDNY